MTASRSACAVFAAGAGLAAGWMLGHRYLGRHQAALFSSRLRRRHAALGFLAGRPAAGTLSVLRDYLAWERHPVLLRRAARVVRRLEHALG